MTELNRNTKVSLSLQYFAPLVVSIFMVAGTFYAMASEEYVDAKVNQLSTKVERMYQFDTKLQLLEHDIAEQKHKIAKLEDSINALRYELFTRNRRTISLEDSWSEGEGARPPEALAAEIDEFIEEEPPVE